jgi:hypothetical protein
MNPARSKVLGGCPQGAMRVYPAYALALNNESADGSAAWAKGWFRSRAVQCRDQEIVSSYPLIRMKREKL